MYLDANFFIFVNTTTDRKGNSAAKILETIIRGKRAVTSVLALDEVMWVLRKKGYTGYISSIIQDIYRTPNLEVKGVSQNIPLRAVIFMEQHGLKPRDAFHLAVMEEFGITEIVTDDKDFDKIPRIKRIKI